MLRSGIAWSDFDYLKGVGGLAVPILLIHGDADRLVHVRTSDALAATRPDLVTYLRLEGVGHLRGWNSYQQAYLQALSDFLTGTVGHAAQIKKR